MHIIGTTVCSPRAKFGTERTNPRDRRRPWIAVNSWMQLSYLDILFDGLPKVQLDSSTAARQLDIDTVHRQIICRPGNYIGRPVLSTKTSGNYIGRPGFRNETPIMTSILLQEGNIPQLKGGGSTWWMFVEWAHVIIEFPIFLLFLFNHC